MTTLTQSTKSTQSDVEAEIEIGQDNAILKEGETLLEQDGSKILEAYIMTQCPPAIAAFLADPIARQVFEFVVDKSVTFIVKEIDNGVFEIYVAAKTGVQIDKYKKAQDSGDTQAVDQTGDALIGLGNE